MKRLIAMVYAVISYLVFFATFLWMILFLGDFEGWAPTVVNSEGDFAWLPSLIINLGLISLIGIQHSIMARNSFKKWWRKFVPDTVERSTYILFSSVAIIILLWFWQPIAGSIWQVEATWASLMLQWGFWLGWLIVVLSTFMINHFDLFGLKQAYDCWKKNEHESPEFMEPGLYNYVRHPLMLGFFIAFWSTPVMTVGHLIFSFGMTVYIFIGVYFEEKVLVREFGQTYKHYRLHRPKIFPRYKRE